MWDRGEAQRTRREAWRDALIALVVLALLLLIAGMDTVTGAPDDVIEVYAVDSETLAYTDTLHVRRLR